MERGRTDGLGRAVGEQCGRSLAAANHSFTVRMTRTRQNFDGNVEWTTENHGRPLRLEQHYMMRVVVVDDCFLFATRQRFNAINTQDKVSTPRTLSALQHYTHYTIRTPETAMRR